MGTPKYIVNLEEFAKLWSNLALYPSLGPDDLKAIEEVIGSRLEEIVDLLRQLLEPKDERCFRSIDLSLHIPAIVNVFVREAVFEQDVYLTGLTFSQTGWNHEDTISLMVGGTRVIDAIHTKELGQQKYFRTFVPVKAGELVRVLVDNASGHSKMFFCDLDYVFL